MLIPSRSDSDGSDNNIVVQEAIERFVYFHYNQHSRPIAFVTSGGTAVDLEENTVRTLENFSTGRRGAVSVEHFLKRGYAVIHLWRLGSASPFARVFQDVVHSDGGFFSVHGLDQFIFCNSISNDGIPLDKKSSSEKQQLLDNYLGSHQRPITLSPRLASDYYVRTALREREHALHNNLLITIPFRTVDQYLQHLHLCSSLLRPCGRMACIYLAAAVSDFYIPSKEKSLHKIHSSANSDGLTLHLRPVPKCISAIREEWAPQAFVVSFKLETQEDMLESMARRAIEKYGVHLVCANLLHTRYDWVWMIPSSSILLMESSAPEQQTKSAKIDVLSTKHGDNKQVDCDLEEQIVLYVAEKHFDYISIGGPGESGTLMTSSALDRIQLQNTFENRNRTLQRQLWWSRTKEFALQFCGSAVGLLLSYCISSLLYNNATHRKRLM